jgi:hypothetical protein
VGVNVADPSGTIVEVGVGVAVLHPSSVAESQVGVGVLATTSLDVLVAYSMLLAAVVVLSHPMIPHPNIGTAITGTPS